MRCSSSRGSPRRRRRRHDHGGFTLPELIIAVAISVLIIGAITGVLIVSLDSEGGVQNRLTNSGASMLTSAFFTRDVQSSVAFTTGPLGLGATPTNGPAVCPDPADPSYQGFVLGLFWASTDSYTIVSYWAPSEVATSPGATTTAPGATTTAPGATTTVPGATTTVPTSTTGNELVRETCINGSATPSSSVVLATDLSTPVAGAPSGWDVTLTPDWAGPCAQDVFQCPPPASGWLTTSWIAALELKVATSPNAGGANGYQFNLVAAPRTESQGTGGAPTTPAATTTAPGATTTAPGATTTAPGATTTAPGATTTVPGATTTTTVPPPSGSPLMLLAPDEKDVIDCSGFDEHLLVGGAAYIASTADNSILLQGTEVSLKSNALYVGTNPASAALDLVNQHGGSVSVTPQPENPTTSESNLLDQAVAWYADLTPPTMLQPGQGGQNETFDTPGTYTLSPGNYGNVDIEGSNNPDSPGISVTLNPGDFGSLTTSGNNVSVTLSNTPDSVSPSGEYYFSGPVSFEHFGGFRDRRGNNTPITLSPGEYSQGIHIRGANVRVILNQSLNPNSGLPLASRLEPYIIGADPSDGIAIDDTGTNNSITGTSGVLLYVSSGEVDLIGFGQSMTLTPESAGPDSPIVLWQAATDSDPINVEGSGSGVSAVGGTIYAPSAVIGASPQHEGRGGWFGGGWFGGGWSGGNSYNLGGLVADGVVCPGFGFQLTVG